MAELTIVKSALIDALTNSIPKLQNFVIDYLKESKFTLPTWANKDNTLQGFYIPCSNITLSDKLKPMLASELEFNQFNKRVFFTYTLGNKYRVNLSISSEGKFGCSLIEVKTGKLDIDKDDISSNSKFEAIVIE